MIMSNTSVENIQIIIDVLLKQQNFADNISSQFNKLSESINRTTEALRTTTSNLGNTVKNLDKTSQSADKTGKSVSKLAQAGQAVKSLTRSFQDLGNALRFSLVSKFTKEMTESVLKTSTQWIRYNNTLQFVYGSTKKTNEVMKFMIDTANKLGVNLEGSIDGFAQLAAAAKGGRLEGQGVIDTYVALTETSSALGLSQYKLQSIFYAITQMISKGTVQTEELKRQLGDQLPGALEMAARSMRMTKSAFVDLVKTGTLKTEDFLPGFVKYLHTEFAETALKNSKTLIGHLERLRTAWFLFKKELGQGEFLDIISEQVIKLTKALKDPQVIEYIKNALNTILKFVSGISKLILEYPKLSLALGGVGVAVSSLVQIITPLVLGFLAIKGMFAGTAVEAVTAEGAVAGLGISFAALGPIIAGVATAIGAFMIIKSLTSAIMDHIEVLRIGKQVSEEYVLKAAEFSKYANVQIKSFNELSKATHDQNQAYLDSIDGSLRYWNMTRASLEAAGKDTTEATNKINALQSAMHDLGQIDPTLVLTRFQKSAEGVSEGTDKVKKSVDDLEQSTEDYSAAVKSIEASYKATTSELNLQLAKREISTEEYNTKSLQNTKDYYEKIVSIKRDALNKLASDKFGTDEYYKAVEELNNAEKDLITTENKLSDAMKKTALSADENIKKLKLEKDTIEAQLKIDFAKGLVNKKEFDKKRLASEVTYWKKVIEVQKKASEDVLSKYGKDSDEYKEIMLKVKKSQLELIKVTGKYKDTMADTGKIGTEAANKTEIAWQALADKLGMTVEQLKTHIQEISNEISGVYKQLDGLERKQMGPMEEGKKYTYAGNVDFSKNLGNALNMSPDDLEKQRKTMEAYGNQHDQSGWFTDTINKYKKLGQLLGELQNAQRTGNISQELRNALTPSDLKALEDSIKQNTQNHNDLNAKISNQINSIDNLTTATNNNSNTQQDNNSAIETLLQQYKIAGGSIASARGKTSLELQKQADDLKRLIAQSKYDATEYKAAGNQQASIKELKKSTKLSQQLSILLDLIDQLRQSGKNTFATGGIIPGVGNQDSVPAMLTPGEFVIRKDVVSSFGSNFFNMLNRGIKFPSIKIPKQKFASGGEVKSEKTVSLNFVLGNKNFSGTFNKNTADELVHTLKQASMVSS